MFLYLHPEIKQHFSSFDQIMQLRGQVYRAVENRCTQRIIIGDTSYFIKQHFGIGWKEIFKNLFQLRLPVISAANEWLAIQHLTRLNIPTLEVLGFGYRGMNPASRQSFLITRELSSFITLEELTQNWQQKPPTIGFKHTLIQQVADMARTLHNNGINHRDFYLCHFLLDLLSNSKHAIKLSLIDLHRAQVRTQVPSRWLLKDLAALYFSSKNSRLTQHDLLRFIKRYRRQSLRDVLKNESAFWWKVKKRGDQLYEDHQ